MNEIPVDPQIWKLAQAILTPKQLLVLELREKYGYSWNQICIATNCARPTAKEHHRAATRNLLNALEAAGGIREALSEQEAEEHYQAANRTPLDALFDSEVEINALAEATAEKEARLDA